MTLQSPFKRLQAATRFRVARLLQQRTVRVTGEWGCITGLADDEVMLRHYGRCGTWSLAIVEALAGAGLMAQQAARPVLFVDVGASIGLVTIGLLRRVPLTAMALEPDAEAHALLLRNLEAQSLASRVRVLRAAAGAPKEPGKHVLLQRHSGNGGDIRIHGETSDPVGAPLVELDELLREEEAEILLKVDVQGYEPEVIAGGRHSFARAGLAVVEFWPYGLRRRGHDPMDFAHRLLSCAGSIALIENEHRHQEPGWIGCDEAFFWLRQFTADEGRPDRQVEILMRSAR